jgi:predicted Fe-S protein YdhL (DUF1289 family)
LTGEHPESPCVGVCRIGDDGYCEGCLRTLAEIAAWAAMNEAERVAVWERLAERARRSAVTGIELEDED